MSFSVSYLVNTFGIHVILFLFAGNVNVTIIIEWSESMVMEIIGLVVRKKTFQFLTDHYVVGLVLVYPIWREPHGFFIWPVFIYSFTEGELL